LAGFSQVKRKRCFPSARGSNISSWRPSIGFGIKDMFGGFLTAGIVFDADLTIGYDTAGLTTLFNEGHIERPH
jgi:hypothetical protein